MKDKDFGKKLRTLRVPTADRETQNAALEKSLAAFAKPAGNEEFPPQPPLATWTWREWLWPSPYAWGAIAGIWLVILALPGTNPVRPSEANPAAFAGAGWDPALGQGSLTAEADYQDVLKQIERRQTPP